jgi:hypothetical protein
MKNIYEIMIDTNTMFKAAIILYERYLNPFNMEAFFLIIMNVLNFVAAHEAQIIDGLNAAERIGPIVFELFLPLATKLLVLTRIVLQTFFSFFNIQVNTIYQSILANIIWLRVSTILAPIIAVILTGVFVTAVIVVFSYLAYKFYQWLNPQTAINADIEEDELIVG